MYTEKGFVNGSVEKEFKKAAEKSASIKKILDEAEASDTGKNNYCEVSHYFSGSCKIMLDEFKSGVFISDDQYEALLAYHHSITENKKIDVYNRFFNPGNFLDLDMNEKFDFVFSSLGFSYEKIYSFLPDVIGLLKVGGVMILEIPSYWFFRDNLNDHENIILDYSMKNDKKWIFSEPVEPIIKECGAELVGIKQLDDEIKTDRLELAYISSLHKLHKAHVENNMAVLETAGIPEKDIVLGKALLAVKKNEKTLNKDNLFSI